MSDSSKSLSIFVKNKLTYSLGPCKILFYILGTGLVQQNSSLHIEESLQFCWNMAVLVHCNEPYRKRCWSITYFFLRTGRVCRIGKDETAYMTCWCCNKKEIIYILCVMCSKYLRNEILDDKYNICVIRKDWLSVFLTPLHSCEFLICSLVILLDKLLDFHRTISF